MNKICVIKLHSGEEIIGEFVKNTDEDPYSGVLKTPVQLAMTSPKEMGFIPYLPYADTEDGIPLSKSNVSFMLSLNDQLANEYRKHFGKVVLPPKASSKLIV